MGAAEKKGAGMKALGSSLLGILMLALPLAANRIVHPEGGFQIDANDGRWAILVGGASGDPDLQRQFLEQLNELYTLLSEKLGFNNDRIFVLFEDVSNAPGHLRFRATRENLEATCGQIARSSKGEDLLFVFITGHGSYDGHTYKLNLVGPDPTAEEFAGWLGNIRANQMILINTTSCSGASLAALAQKGRIVVTATKSGNERNQTHFGPYFIEAFKNNAGDQDKNGRVSILEAFKYASQKIEEFYTKAGSLQTEHPVFNDSGDHEAYTLADSGSGAGAVIANTYLNSGLSFAGVHDLNTEEKGLLAEAQVIEAQIDALKREKARLSSADYESKLEALLIRLAQIHAKLRNRQK
jgi:hypothetical protein